MQPGQPQGKIIVVGGPTRAVGKTTLVCALIQALSEFRWTAVKITADNHGLPAPLWEETVPNPRKGTGRYLAAGAERAFVLTATQEAIQLDLLWATLAPGANLIIESNRVLDELRPDLCLALLGQQDAAKPSFAPFAARAHALLGSVLELENRSSASPPQPARPPLFPTTARQPLPEEVLAWVRRALHCAAAR